MGEGACQLHALNRPSCGCELTSEAIPISVANLQPQLLIFFIVHIIMQTLSYVHSNISVICIVMITQVISHSVAGHQGLRSVRAKPINAILNLFSLSLVRYRPCGDKQKMSNFIACHHCLSCVY